jgi:hypothetical protein
MVITPERVHQVQYLARASHGAPLHRPHQPRHPPARRHCRVTQSQARGARASTLVSRDSEESLCGSKTGPPLAYSDMSYLLSAPTPIASSGSDADSQGAVSAPHSLQPLPTVEKRRERRHARQCQPRGGTWHFSLPPAQDECQHSSCARAPNPPDYYARCITRGEGSADGAPIRELPPQ